MSEINKAVCRRFIEQVWNNRNLAAIDELVTPNYVRHVTSGPDFGTGPESVRKTVRHYLAAFPDIRFVIEELIGEADIVAVRWTAHATHRGDFEGIPPTGKQITVTGVSIVRLTKGKCMETWENSDALGLLRQLGAFPQQTASHGA